MRFITQEKTHMGGRTLKYSGFHARDGKNEYAQEKSKRLTKGTPSTKKSLTRIRKMFIDNTIEGESPAARQRGVLKRAKKVVTHR